jgi:hypothetical protein
MPGRTAVPERGGDTRPGAPADVAGPVACAYAVSRSSAGPRALMENRVREVTTQRGKWVALVTGMTAEQVSYPHASRARLPGAFAHLTRH